MLSFERILEIVLAGKHNCVLFGCVKGIDYLMEYDNDIVILKDTSGKDFCDETGGLLICCYSSCRCEGLFFSECYCSLLDMQYAYSNMPRKVFNLADIYVPIKNVNHSLDFEKINMVRKIQEYRYERERFRFNGELNRNTYEKYCRMEHDAHVLIREAQKSFKFSMNEMDKVFRVARTIADMESREVITRYDVGEALGYVSCYAFLKRRVLDVF